MKRSHVESVSIDSIGYDGEKKILEVEFNGGGVYRYFKVPLRVYHLFINAESKGRFFSEEIREKYEYEKM